MWTGPKVGQACRIYRQRAGMSLREIAEKVGVNRSTLSRFEQNKRVQKMDRIVDAYAEALEVEADELWRAASRFEP